MASGQQQHSGALLAFLQSELLVLSNEARRKYPDIKDALDKVFTWLRELKENPGNIDIAVEVGKSHDLLVPLLQASRTGNAKMLAIAVGCLHRLITYNALSSVPFFDLTLTSYQIFKDADTAEVVFGVLSEAIKGSDDVQLKALQCIMPLLSNSVNTIHGDQLVQAYLIGFRLHGSSSVIVKNAAVAIVRQMVIWLFEQVSEEDSHLEGKEVSEEERPYARYALSIFQDICVLLNDEEGQVLKLSSVDKTFALELVESVLAYHARIFRKHPEYVVIVREKICTVAVRRFTEGCVFPQAARLWRVVTLLLREFHDVLPLECEILISFLPRLLLDEEHPKGWEKALVLETVREIFSEHVLMLELYAICDLREASNSPKVFHDIVMATCQHMLREAVRAAESGVSGDYKQADVKISLVSQMDKEEAPTLPGLYTLHLSFDALASWIRGSLLIFQNPEQFDKRIVKLNEDPSLLKNSWTELLRALFSLFGMALRGDWHRLLFGTLEDLGKLVSHFGLCEQQAELLGSILELEARIDGWRTCLEIVLYDPETFKELAWKLLVDGIHTLDLFRPNEADQGKIAALQRLVTRLFEERSLTMSTSCFKLFLTASLDIAADQHSIRRVKQLALTNVKRFAREDETDEGGWARLHSLLLELLASEADAIRAQVIELYGQLCQAYFTAADGATFQLHPALQKRVLDCLLETLTVDRNDVEQLAVDTLGRLVQTLGPYLSCTEGWPFIFRLLDEVLIKDHKSILRPSFYCVRLVASDFLPFQDDAGIGQVMGLVGRFVKQKDDLNISLTAVGQLWDVSDFLRISRKERKLSKPFALWLEALGLLVGASVKEDRPEIRNSAVQTLLRAVELYAPALDAAEWSGLFKQILGPLCEALKANQSEAWDETRILALQGLVRIFTEFHLILSVLPEYPGSFWAGLLAFIEDGCGRAGQEVVSVSVACLHHLVTGRLLTDIVWEATWQTWYRIAQEDLGGGCFTQESLDKLVGCFTSFIQHAAPSRDVTWLSASLDVLDAAFRCPLAKGEAPVRDVDQCSALQHSVLLQLDLIDWNHWGLAAQKMAVDLLASWLRLAPELRTLEMTRSGSVRRTRHPVNMNMSSRPNSPSAFLPAPGAGPEKTYIAMAWRILSAYERYHLASWSLNPDFYACGAFTLMLRAVGRLMVLKYRAASSPSPASDETWKQATRTFNSLLTCASKEFMDEACWSDGVVQVLEQSLESSRRMVPATLSVDQLGADELFDIQQVIFIKEQVLPAMASASDRTLQRLLLALEASSHLYFDAQQSSPRLSPQVDCQQTGSNETVPVIKERFAITCLQALFDICHANTSSLPRNIIKVALRILLTRSEAVIRSYISDRRLQGSKPFPRLRQDEMLFILSALVALRLAPGLAAEALLPPADPTDSPTEAKRKDLAGSDIGHLFYIYPTLWSAMEIQDEEVARQVRAAFRLIGRSSGLMPDSE